MMWVNARARTWAQVVSYIVLVALFIAAVHSKVAECATGQAEGASSESESVSLNQDTECASSDKEPL